MQGDLHPCLCACYIAACVFAVYCYCLRVIVLAPLLLLLPFPLQIMCKICPGDTSASTTVAYYDCGAKAVPGRKGVCVQNVNAHFSCGPTYGRPEHVKTHVRSKSDTHRAAMEEHKRIRETFPETYAKMQQVFMELAEKHGYLARLVTEVFTPTTVQGILGDELSPAVEKLVQNYSGGVTFARELLAKARDKELYNKNEYSKSECIRAAKELLKNTGIKTKSRREELLRAVLQLKLKVRNH